MLYAIWATHDIVPPLVDKNLVCAESHWQQDVGLTINALLTANLAAPVIDTERLRLRPHQLGDAPDCVAMWADPEIARFTIGDPSPPPRTRLRILGYRGHWQLLGFG
jgi:hypothetical protein